MNTNNSSTKSPKWNWWQTGLFLAIVIFAFRVDVATASEIMKAVFEAAIKVISK